MNVLSRPPALPAAVAASPHDLVRTGDIERFADALDAGVDPNARDRPGMTPPLVPVQHVRTEAIGFLGRAGADPDPRRSGMREFSPLHEAAHRDCLDAIQALLKLGAGGRASARHSPCVSLGHRVKRCRACLESGGAARPCHGAGQGKEGRQVTESQIIDMLTSPVQQCRVRNGRIQVKRHRPISDAGHDSGRSWGDWITVAVSPSEGCPGQDRNQHAS